MIPALLQILRDAVTPGKARREAGLELGRLGWLPDDLDAWVEIPRGAFLCGEPRERGEIPYPYWIGKYPVTHAQFLRFIQDEGYQRRELWGEAGAAWMLAKGYLAPREFEKTPWNAPLLPVVNVSWYEAQAYCAWLNTVSSEFLPGYGFRLAKHAEWERAARGTDGREFPWGNVFDPTAANTNESAIQSTTPVCQYPQGVSPTGVWDMGGNVFEWVEQYGLRGGCWDNSHWFARCAWRDWYNPESYFTGVGFRVVCGPVD